MRGVVFRKEVKWLLSFFHSFFLFWFAFHELSCLPFFFSLFCPIRSAFVSFLCGRRYACLSALHNMVFLHTSFYVFFLFAILYPYLPAYIMKHPPENDKAHSWSTFLARLVDILHLISFDSMLLRFVSQRHSLLAVLHYLKSAKVLFTPR